MALGVLADDGEHLVSHGPNLFGPTGVEHGLHQGLVLLAIF